MPRLRNSIAALSLVQLSGYLIPLVTLPYLTRVLGPETFGRVVFVQAFVTYLVLFVEYGFVWSATRKVSIHRADRETLSQTFTATWAAQWLLVVIGGVVAAVAVLSVDRLRADSTLYLAAFATVLGTALFPVWFLQGLEKFQLVSVIQVITRLLAIVPIFLFVKGPSDAVWVLISQGGGTILAGCLVLLWVQRNSIVIWRIPRWPAIVAELRDGGVLFASRASISIYTALVPLVLGWVAGPVALAYFNVANRLRLAAQALITPLSQAIFPRSSNLIKTNPSEAYGLLTTLAPLVFAVSLSLSIALYLGAEILVVTIAGVEFSASVELLQLLALCPFLVGLSNFFGVQVLIASDKNRVILFSSTTVAVFVVASIHYVIEGCGDAGAAMVLVMAEAAITLLYAFFAIRLMRSMKQA